MRLRNIPGSREVIADSEICIHEEEKAKGRWGKIFGNDHPIEIEIGMGKGQFILEKAKQNPDINYVGIEKFSSVLLRGIQKMEELRETGSAPENLRFIRMEAEHITDVFAKDEVNKIYLNFSDPWPKDRHAKRRLPSKEFLGRYAQILVPTGTLEFKTDNQDLFTFALEQADLAGWTKIAVTRDLHHDAVLNEGNIMTEYEAKFSAMGNPICKLILKR